MQPYVYYDPKTDALALVLSDAKAMESEEIAEDIILGYDEDNNVVLIEVLNHARDLFADLIQKVGSAERAG